MTQELRKLADDLDAEFAQGRISNHNGRKAAAEIRLLLDRVEGAEKALKVAANALSLALSDIDWRKDSPTQPVIHKAYQKVMEASK